MAEEPGQTNPEINNPTPPVAPSTAPTAPSIPEDTQKELDRLKKVEAEYQAYKESADPVFQTLNSDEKLLGEVIKSHKKRLGVPVQEDTTTPPTTPTTTPQVNPADTDTRSAVVNQIYATFEDSVGISKLSEDEQKAMRGKVGSMIKELLDPNGNKTLQQVFDDVSLTKLPWYLDKAYKLATNKEQQEAAYEKGKREALGGDTGVVGSLTGSDLPIDSISLSPKEKEIAKKQGLTEEEYLAEKKKILLRQS